MRVEFREPIRGALRQDRPLPGVIAALAPRMIPPEKVIAKIVFIPVGSD
ncbi:MAG: hypothetical protein ACTSYB_02515 [Candidatus Helarchaeota archaeon]